MIWFYLKAAYRNLSGHKWLTVINVAGLSIGLTCSILILLWVQDELSMDRFYHDSSRIYAVYEQVAFDHHITGQYFTPAPLAEQIRLNIPEIEFTVATNFNFSETHNFQRGGEHLQLKGSFAEVDFFKLFNYPLLAGHAETALNKAGTIAISQKMAILFFGSPVNAMGKRIRYEGFKDLTVSAVFLDVKPNSSLQFDYIIDWFDFMADNQWTKKWDYNSPMTFIELKDGADPFRVRQQLNTVLRKNSFYKTKATYVRLALQKNERRYLWGDFKNGEPISGRIQYVRLFSIIASFILVIACINFMNLATARSMSRAKEVSVRKLVGAGRRSLIAQLFCESILVTLFSVFLALFMLFNLLPFFNMLTQKNIALPFDQWQFWLKLFLLSIFTGFTSGLYPAFVLSRFDPLYVLRGKYKRSSNTKMFRQGLVIFQFAISAILIICMMVISRQVNFVSSARLGYDPVNVVEVPIEGKLFQGYERFKQETLGLPGVLSVTRSFASPTRIYFYTTEVHWMIKGSNPKIAFANNSIGYDFIRTMNIKMVAGRDFSPKYPGDTSAFLVNESAVKRMGLVSPLGKTMSLGGRKGYIIGVMKDFHHVSLREPIEPLIFSLGENDSEGFALVRIAPGEMAKAIAGLGLLYKKFNPDFQFTYRYLKVKYHDLYQSEYTIERLSDIFAAIAILISCLGLLGMAIFTAGQREKEIAIRKVLGAGNTNLFNLAVTGFLWPVMTGVLIASPVAWFLMQSWLNSYAYHIPIDLWAFILNAVICIGLALLTVGVQVVKTMLGRPIRLLRND